MRPTSRMFWIPLLLIAVILVAGCTAMPLALRSAAPPTLDEFRASLIANLVSRNYAGLQAQMGSPFVFAAWQGTAQEMTPADAMTALQSSLFDESAQMTFVADEVIAAWLGGADPLALWPETVNPVDAIGIAGLGAGGAAAAVLVIAEYPEGGYYWYAALVAEEGFDGSPAIPPDIADIPPGDGQLLLPSDVTSVLVLGNIGIFDGPGPQFLVIGSAQRGESFPVVGASADGQWWAVICPQQSNTCWITANPTFVQPQQPTPPTPTAAPTAPPAAGPQRIIFAPGQMATMVTGVADPALPAQFLLFAASAQRVSFLFESPNMDANFIIRGVADGVLYKAPNQLAREFAFTSTRSQDYLITVTSPAAAPFSLTVAFTSTPAPTPRPQPTATPVRPTATPTRVPPPGPERITIPPGGTSAVRSGSLAAHTPRQFVFYALQNQQARVLMTSPSPAANFAIVGVSDGVTYKPFGNPLREFSFVLPRSQDYLIILQAPVNTSFVLELTVTGGTPPTPTNTPPAPPAERITFPPGADSATRSGPLYANTIKRYVFNAQAGQTATITFNSPSPAANFSVVGVTDGIPYKTMGNSAWNFTFVLPMTQDYLISILAPVNTSFVLTLHIPPGGPTPTPTNTPPAPPAERITFPPGADSATRSGPLYANTLRRFVFNAQAGQIATITLGSPSPAANFSVVGVTDGIPYKTMGNSARTFTFTLPMTQDYLISILAPVNTSFTLTLYIPPLLATPTPTPTGTALPSATPTATATGTAEPPTATPTGTTAPATPTATATNTALPPTATPTNTPEPPTATPTDTPEPPTATPTDTPEPPTATPTNTPEPPTATPTDTPEPPTATPTDTPEPTATAT